MSERFKKRNGALPQQETAKPSTIPVPSDQAFLEIDVVAYKNGLSS